MPDPKKHTHAEIKRLRKSVKRRRGYVENLRMSARSLTTDEDAAFVERLHALADDELASARNEETQAAMLIAEKDRNAGNGLPSYSSAESRQRAENAMTAMTGRFAIDRVKRLAEHHGVGDPNAGSMRVTLDAIEATIGIVHYGDLPMTGKRIDLAEIRTFGAVQG